MENKEFYDIIDETANLNEKQLKEYYEKAKLAETKFCEGARQFFSRNLSGTSEDNPRPCDITLEHGYFGMGNLEMPHISAMYMDYDGVVWVRMDGCEFDAEIDDFSMHHQIEMIEKFY